MSYILYKTTNIINGRYYIGVTNGNNPSYKGSGTALKEAFKKYGKSSFKRETLEEFLTEEDAFRRESEIVNIDFVNNPDTYNIKVGGKGGTGQLKTVEHKRRISESIKQLYATNKCLDQRHSGRKMISDPDALVNAVKQHGFKGAASLLGLTFHQCRDRYYRYIKKLK
jgi:hypothetical protein